MKVKTSITLSEDVFKFLDDLKKEFKNRSEAIEQALLFFMRQRQQKKLESKELKILNKRAGWLNKEAADALDYQVQI